MYSDLDHIDVTYGFLIVKPYAAVYHANADRFKLTRDVYAIPRIDREAERSPIQYRGLDRDALSDYSKSNIAGEVRMAELNLTKRCSDGILFNESDADAVFGLLPDPNQFELIWTRLTDCNQHPPKGFVTTGFEPTWYLGDHFSASCDCMLFPRWHGTDIEDGTLFLEHFRKLNRFGLFNTPSEATDFLEFYLSFDWTETGDYGIVEVFIRE